MKTQDKMVHPEDSKNFSYWTKKWRVSSCQLNDAIIHTGSLNPKRLKEYLKRENWWHVSFFGLLKLFKNRGVSFH